MTNNIDLLQIKYTIFVKFDYTVYRLGHETGKRKRHRGIGRNILL